MPTLFAYLCCMSYESTFATYLAGKRFCDRLEQAARRKPTFGADPIHNFIQAASRGTVIEWHSCTAVAERMEELTRDLPYMGEIARPALTLARRLRSAASAEIPFSLR